MLQLPAVDEAGLIAMPADELVERRLLEVEFGKASDELRQLAREGNGAMTRRKLQQMEEQFGHHPWLKAKMVQMRRLAEEDMDMMIKEVSYSSMRMSKSLASRSEVIFCMDETESNMPAFLRKKETEGRGRRTPKES
jgi:chromatin segregation and condensation protein Rec8/ScpA/Scc1 (kleisin family)